MVALVPRRILLDEVVVVLVEAMAEVILEEEDAHLYLVVVMA
jgi:hypothetical protein